jgi:hypothetical protein
MIEFTGFVFKEINSFFYKQTSPTTTSENDSDSGIAYTPPMPIGMDDTVINLDNFGK